MTVLALCEHRVDERRYMNRAEYKAAAHAFRYQEFCAEQRENFLSGHVRMNRFAIEAAKAEANGIVATKPAGFDRRIVYCKFHAAKLRREEYAKAKRAYFDALHTIQFSNIDSRVHREACFRLNHAANAYRYQRDLIRRALVEPKRRAAA